MADYMLSTEDNPFNPYTQWEQWYAFDFNAGYHTPSYLARVVRSSSELSDADQEISLNEAIDEIIEYSLRAKYIKVSNPDP